MPVAVRLHELEDALDRKTAQLIRMERLSLEHERAESRGEMTAVDAIQPSGARAPRAPSPPPPAPPAAPSRAARRAADSAHCDCIGVLISAPLLPPLRVRVEACLLNGLLRGSRVMQERDRGYHHSLRALLEPRWPHSPHLTRVGLRGTRHDCSSCSLNRRGANECASRPNRLPRL